MSDIQTIDQPAPTVGQFKDAVNQQLQEWNQTTVEGLCYSQTARVITNLMPYYGDPASSDTRELDVDTFREMVRSFQEKQERLEFADVTDPEIQELIALLAPYFHPLKEEQAGSNTDFGNLDNHPF